MKKAYYRTDFLFSKMSFFIGMGSILSLFYSYYEFNCSGSSSEADRTALESDFGTVGCDLYDAMKLL